MHAQDPRDANLRINSVIIIAFTCENQFLSLIRTVIVMVVTKFDFAN